MGASKSARLFVLTELAANIRLIPTDSHSLSYTNGSMFMFVLK